jgi:hemolysin III
MLNFNPTHNLRDGGLWYTETDPSHLVVEPFNALSAFVFIGIAAWWMMQLRGRFRERTFLYISTLILLTGAVGGTIYHAFRYSPIFILMDWLPILILCLMASVYFLYHTLNNIWFSLAIMLGFITVQVITWNIGNTTGHHNININYAMMAITVLAPLLFFMRKKHFENWHLVAMATGCFALALFFRVVDREAWIPSGTHFLWHIFGAIACHQMFLFIYRSYTPVKQRA